MLPRTASEDIDSGGNGADRVGGPEPATTVTANDCSSRAMADPSVRGVGVLDPPADSGTRDSIVSVSVLHQPVSRTPSSTTTGAITIHLLEDESSPRKRWFHPKGIRGEPVSELEPSFVCLAIDFKNGSVVCSLYVDDEHSEPLLIIASIHGLAIIEDEVSDGVRIFRVDGPIRISSQDSNLVD